MQSECPQKWQNSNENFVLFYRHYVHIIKVSSIIEDYPDLALSPSIDCFLHFLFNKKIGSDYRLTGNFYFVPLNEKYTVSNLELLLGFKSD